MYVCQKKKVYVFVECTIDFLSMQMMTNRDRLEEGGRKKGACGMFYNSVSKDTTSRIH